MFKQEFSEHTRGALLGKFARVETLDGSVREGKITGVYDWPIEVNGETELISKGIELNGDRSDTIDFFAIRRMNLR